MNPHHDDPFLTCVRIRESGDNYAAVNPAGPYLGAYQFTVGWLVEPTYVGVQNAVQLLVHDAKGSPVDDIGDGLKVQVLFGSQKPRRYRAAVWIDARPPAE